VATEGDAVILGTGNAEAAPYTIRTDLEGRKQWGTTAAGHTLAVHKGFGYFVAWASDGNLKKFDLPTGRMTAFSGGQPMLKAPGKGPRRGLASGAHLAANLYLSPGTCIASRKAILRPPCPRPPPAVSWPPFRIYVCNCGPWWAVSQHRPRR
jgi:hypothetical protein